MPQLFNFARIFDIMEQKTRDADVCRFQVSINSNLKLIVLTRTSMENGDCRVYVAPDTPETYAAMEAKYQAELKRDKKDQWGDDIEWVAITSVMELLV